MALSIRFLFSIMSSPFCAFILTEKMTVVLAEIMDPYIISYFLLYCNHVRMICSAHGEGRVSEYFGTSIYSVSEKILTVEAEIAIMESHRSPIRGATEV